MTSTTPGALIADRYRLVRPLGAGSSATVWEASDGALDRTVAVKLLHSSALADPTERERLRREARALARLAHPHITVVFDYLEQAQPDGTPLPVLVTELLAGMPLSERLRSGPMPPAEAVAVCAQLADALQAAHQAGIVHRDVKPANVVLTAGGVKLLDFGIAQAASDSNLTGGMAIGTPACMAPEQLTGRGAVPASDVYALGCVMYWCLTGRAPYESADIAQVAQAHVYAPAPPLEGIAGLPLDVARLYALCMSKDAATRPSAAEVYGRLTQAFSQSNGQQTPTANQTLVMAPFDLPTQPRAHPAAPERSAPSGAAGPAASAEARAGMPRTRLIAGGVAIALVTAGITALVLDRGTSNGTVATPPPSQASTPAAAGQSSNSPAPSPSSSVSMGIGVPPGSASGLLAYVEDMRAQIDGFIAQGQETIDPNTGRDLQNSLADLENALAAASAAKGKHQLRDVQGKIRGLQDKVSGDVDEGKLSQGAATQLTAELQNVSDAVAALSGGDGGDN